MRLSVGRTGDNNETKKRNDVTRTVAEPNAGGHVENDPGRCSTKVAQQPEFYSDDVEHALADEVERPGNAAIDKLLGQEQLDNAERTQLSLYMVIMATRGPRQRRKSLGHAWQALESVVRDTRSEIGEWMKERPEDVERTAERLAELNVVEERFSTQIPAYLLDQIRTPFWSERFRKPEENQQEIDKGKAGCNKGRDCISPLTEHASRHRTDNKAQSKGRANQSKGFGAILGIGDVSDISLGHADVASGQTVDDTAGK